MKSLFLVAGDSSGDLHGANLIRELKAARPDVHVAAMGGPRMQAEADEFLFDLVSRGLSGFIDPLTQILFIKRLLSVVRRHLDRRRPAAVVPIDFYGFNHQVLGLAKHRGIPAFYYISPQVWASRPGRVQRLKRLVERMLLIFPFELPIYRDAGVPCSFVGHPLLDLIPEPAVKPSCRADAPTVGLLPGSRLSETNRHLPVFLEAMRLIRTRFPRARARLFLSRNIPESSLPRGLGENGSAVELVRESGYGPRAEVDLALTCSGTATLENALLGVPMVVVYQTNWPTYWIAKSVIRVPHIAMANILAGKRLVPELIQADFTPRRVADEALALFERPESWVETRRELLSLRELLGGPGAAKRAASIILESVGVL